MNLPIVDGRECVPVRLLPSLTAWQTLHPDMVARLFSHREEWRNWSASTFCLQRDGKYHALRPRDWDNIVNALTALSRELKLQEAFEFQKEQEWRQRSMELLPASVFLWKSDLISDYAGTFGRQWRMGRQPVGDDLSDERADSEDAACDTAGRAGDGELNFTPLLSPENERVVFEGFESVLAGSQALAHPRQAEPERAMLDEFAKQQAAPVAAVSASAASAGPVPAVAAPEPVSETSKDRDDRRYRELKAAGGDYIYENGLWHVTGRRGLLAKLCKREQAAARPMSDEKDVRESLKKAAKRAKDAARKGRSVFDQ